MPSGSRPCRSSPPPKPHGHARVAEMNRQVAGNLDKIITALEDEGPDEKEAAAGAS